MSQANRVARKKLAFYQAQTDRKTIKAIELFEKGEFEYWSKITWVKIMFTYCDNAFNKEQGRVGRIAGFRIATRNLDLIPSADKPKSRRGGRVTRYYDVTRAGTTVSNGITSGGLPGKVTSNAAQPGQWRSFQPNTFSILVEIWSQERETWVTKAEDYTINDTISG